MAQPASEPDVVPMNPVPLAPPPPSPPAATPASLTPAAPRAPAPAVRDRSRRWRRLALLTALFAGVALSAAGYVASSGGWYTPLAQTAAALPEGVKAPRDPAATLAALAPRGVYVTVDSYHNRLRVFRNGELQRDAVCSTGSGVLLRDPETGRQWVFDTPQGERRVQRKVRDPVWRKPDWAFIEEGYRPPASFRERTDDFSLGDYGLYLGDGYIIHGTVFQSLLGQRITHGCIRLGDADLEYAYRNVPLGARVYLF